ncbi:GNAT family N-acetyltransferase [Mycolicibacterium frederiksbergense]|uniref:GNAT family N-acetyltransferase n=1 Tax=Mycolicibacterium frederiksbergense TaxID=117567 RepID=UPI00247591E8|nr:GNAT family N-acetyltransferase [Mycolicibacterium frederiksbergense]
MERGRLDDSTLATAWKQLQGRGGVRTPFLSHEWYGAMAAVPTLIASAEALVCRRGEAVVGLLPVEITVRDGLRTLGVAGWHWFTPDHLDVVAAPEDQHDVARHIATHLAGRRDWDVLDLDALAEDSVLAPALRSAMRPPRFVARPDEAVSIRSRRVAATEEPTVGKWSRKRLRRTLRLIEQHGGTLELVSDPDQVPVLLDTLMSLHRARFQDRSTVFATPERRRFHRIAARAMSEAGQARIARLAVGDVDAALLYVLSWRSTAYLYSSGLRPEILQSGGSALRDWVFTQASSEGFDTVDFLRGDQEWKDHLADTVSHDTRVRVVRMAPRVAATGVRRTLARRYRHQVGQP